MEKCSECGKEEKENRNCEYCGKTFCGEHLPTHLGWERRHEGLAEDSSRIWKRKRGD